MIIDYKFLRSNSKSFIPLWSTRNIFLYFLSFNWVHLDLVLLNQIFLGSIIRIHHRICAMIWESQFYGVRKSQRMTILNLVQFWQTLAFVVLLLLTMIVTTKLLNHVQARQHFILMSKDTRAVGRFENSEGLVFMWLAWYICPPRWDWGNWLGVPWKGAPRIQQACIWFPIRKLGN